jgi:hypothetical protein
VSIRFFSGEEDARRAGQPARESQQALLLRLLREADGAPVSYERLRNAGIELPASVVSELELAGIPIEHVYEGGGAGARRPGVKLNPALDPERAAAEAEATVESGERPTPAPGRIWTIPSGLRPRLPSGIRPGLPSGIRSGLPSGIRPGLPSGIRLNLPALWRSDEHRPTARALAPIALIGAMIVVIAVIVIALQTSRVSSRHTTRHHVSNPQPRSAVIARTPQTPPPQPPATPVSPTLATQFEAQGHDLLQSGQYGDAVPVLRRALVATGMHLSDCLEPVNDTCLTYAYAMYDLGRALELKGDPTAALPVLEKRLEIDNQRAVVAAELEHVRTITQP